MATRLPEAWHRSPNCVNEDEKTFLANARKPANALYSNKTTLKRVSRMREPIYAGQIAEIENSLCDRRYQRHAAREHLMKLLRTIVLISAASFPWVAKATPIAPVGTTDVTVAAPVLDFLGAAGIVASPIPPGSVDGATFSFPIVGGELSPLGIEHLGGIRFQLGADFIEASNFLVEATGVTADVTGTAFPSDVTAPIFDLSDVLISNGTITADLVVNETLNEALGLTFFGSGEALDLTGLVFGTATTSPTPVPLPAGLALLGGSLAALVAARRRAV